MTSGEWVIVSPLIIAAVFCVWFYLPVTFYIIRPGDVHTSFKENDNSKLLDRPDVIELMAKIKTLNFRYIGIKIETLPLWRPPIEEVSLSSAETQAFVSIIAAGKKVVYYFYTPFSDGKLVLTANSLFSSITNNEVIQSKIAASSPDEILQIHKQNVTRFLEKGSKPYSEYTK